MMTLSMLDKIFSRQDFDRSNFIQEVYQFPYKYNLQEIKRIADALHLFPLNFLLILKIKKISPPKTDNFQIKSTDIFHISLQNIDGEAVLTTIHNLCF